MSAIASKITSLTIVFSTVFSDAGQRKHQSSASLAFVQGIHRGPVNSPHKWPVTRKMFAFGDVIMKMTWSLVTQLTGDQSQHQFKQWLVLFFWKSTDKRSQGSLADIWRNHNVIITSKQRTTSPHHFDVIMTLSLCHESVGYPLQANVGELGCVSQVNNT